MTRNVRSSVATTLALGLLCVAAAAATAGTFTQSPGGAMTAVSSGRITFENGIGTSMACNVTLSGSLTRRFSDVEGSQTGSISSGRASECAGNGIGLTVLMTGTINLLIPLGPPPYEVGYLSWIEGFAFLIESLLEACLFNETVGALFGFQEGELRIALLPRNQRLTRVTTLRGTCPRAPVVTGSFAVSPGQTLSWTP